MSILTPADQSVWFPEVQISGNALVAAIRRAQLTAESAKGANRPLERHQIKEVKRVYEGGCNLSRIPIALIPLPLIEIRYGGYIDGWRRGITLTEWETISAEEYALDTESGRLTLLNHEAIEVRATYTAGFDFSENSQAVNEIKAAVAAILVYQTAGR